MYIDRTTQLGNERPVMSSESTTMLGMSCSASDREEQEEHLATATLRKQVDVAIIGES